MVATARRSKSPRSIELGHVRWTRIANLAILLLVLLGIAVALAPPGPIGPAGAPGGGGRPPLVSLAGRNASTEQLATVRTAVVIHRSAAGADEGPG